VPPSPEVWIFTVLAALNFILQDWPTTKSGLRRLWRSLCWVVLTAWHWSATWSWEAVCSIGWLGMVTVNEYAIGLCFLSAAAFGAFSKLCHRKSKDGNWQGATAIGTTAIVIGFVLAVLVTIANKGNKSWSPTMSLIDSRLAERVPLTPFPEFSPHVPSCHQPITHTSKTTLTVIDRELELQRRTSLLRPTVVEDKARYEASFWPAQLTDWPIRRKTIQIINGVVPVTLTFMVKDHMAKKAKTWLRLCRGCAYAKEPTGFKNLNDQHANSADDPNERLLNVGDFLPNVAYAPIIAIEVIPPPGQDHFDIGLQVGCENCAPIDANGFQVLRVDLQP
jgi:hypothetical protein